MGFLDRLLGRQQPDRGVPQHWPGSASAPSRAPEAGEPRGGGPAPSRDDEQALERYRYLVRTAPPDRIEQAHEEAFARLTSDQRRQALEQLSAAVPAGERGDRDDPRSLARMATRAELREPGTVERAFGGGFGGGGLGGGRVGGFGGGFGGMGVPLLGSFATAFAGTLAAEALFSDLADGELFDGPRDDSGHDAGDYDQGGDAGGGGDAADSGAGLSDLDQPDMGGDLGGDFGGDFGGDGGF